MTNLVILGSTGKIGQTTLDVVRMNPTRYKVVGISGNHNIDLLKKQAEEFKVTHVALGADDAIRLVSLKSVDTVVVAIPGAAALESTMTAIAHGKNLALASKEIVVMAGDLILSEAKRRRVKIIPIDSELSAILQCLKAGTRGEIEKIILACSGGPFLGKKNHDLQEVTPEAALKHPKWKMGKKINIDSATLMNKGFEVIEIYRYFGISPEDVEVTIHPECIFHSGILFHDGALIAQMGLPDKHLQVQYALTYPQRDCLPIKKLSLTEVSKLTFQTPDLETFPCLQYAYEAIKIGGTMPTVLATTDEVVVGLFLERKIKFLDIPRLIKQTMEQHKVILQPSIDEIVEADQWARKKILYGF